MKVVRGGERERERGERERERKGRSEKWNGKRDGQGRERERERERKSGYRKGAQLAEMKCLCMLLLKALCLHYHKISVH